MFLTDQETATDLLHYEAIARTVVRLIRMSPHSPITVGVHGDWGAGKSSVLKMTEAAFRGDQRIQCIWFNGWAFEGFEDAKTVVIETIVEELQRARPPSKKLLDAVQKVLKRVSWLKAAKKAGGLAFNVLTGLPSLGQLGDLINAVGRYMGKQASELTRKDVEGFIDGAAGLFKPAEGDTLPGHIHAFRAEFKELLDAAEIDQLIVIVDDLDRCLPETAIATLEAIRLFLFVERTAFVIGADEAMIEYAVRDHFPELPPSSGPITYARNYLEKLIQVPFRIPAMGLAETRTYIALLMLETELGSEDPRFLGVLEVAREDMRRPWLSKGLNRALVATAIGKGGVAMAARALTLSDQLTRLLTDGTRGNPRQVKRFLNSLMLRAAIGEERGFGDEIDIPMLAKLILAERFQTNFFEYIVRMVVLAKDGVSPELAALEKALLDAAKPKSGGAPPPGALLRGVTSRATESTEFEAWLANDWVRTWASLAPKLEGEDLRAYIFITRDKRVALGGAQMSSHLEHLAEQLMGSAFQANKVAAEVRKLGGVDAEDLFNDVVSRLSSADNFRIKPKAGLDGLILLAKSHPALERRLLEFAGALDIAQLGAWPPSAFDGVFQSAPLVMEWDALIKSWAEQTTNAKLKTAAAAVLALRTAN